MKVNRAIRAPTVRVIGPDGAQLGIMGSKDALKRAESMGLDLVEVASNTTPPVCRIIDYGKYRYQQTKKEKESKKAQHQIKVKEIKVKPNIDVHDFQTKEKRAREFIEKGLKVRVTCMFRGREMLHMDLGTKVMQKMCEDLSDVASVEMPMKQMGRMITLVLSPMSKKK
ncbi:MAG: translation initiation factor IF-3 [Parachlamydiales bacterium]|nr:translation initiation factor IF-3 [Parachlamydiales bacterium]